MISLICRIQEKKVYKKNICIQTHPAQTHRKRNQIFSYQSWGERVEELNEDIKRYKLPVISTGDVINNVMAIVNCCMVY